MEFGTDIRWYGRMNSEDKGLIEKNQKKSRQLELPALLELFF